MRFTNPHDDQQVTDNNQTSQQQDPWSSDSQEQVLETSPEEVVVSWAFWGKISASPDAWNKEVLPDFSFWEDDFEQAPTSIQDDEPQNNQPSVEAQEESSEQPNTISLEDLEQDGDSSSDAQVNIWEDTLKQDSASEAPQDESPSMFSSTSPEETSQDESQELPSFSVEEDTPQEQAIKEHTAPQDEQSNEYAQEEYSTPIPDFSDLHESISTWELTQEQLQDEEILDDNQTEEAIEEDNQTEEIVDENQNEETIEEDTNLWEHPIHQNYEDFRISLKDLLKLHASSSVQLVGLRTEDQQIYYTFTKQDNSITIQKDEDNNILQFEKDDDTLRVSINGEELIIYNWTILDADDITHYLNEKLWKFTLMLQTEADKFRKEKDRKKELKEILKNF